MATPAYVQHKSGQASASSLAVAFDSNVTAGSAVIVLLTTTDANNRTYTVSDGNAYTALTRQGTTRPSQIFYYLNHAGGACTVTVTGSGTSSLRVTIVEVSGVTAFDAESGATDTNNVTSHPCAASGALDTAADVFVIAGGGLSSTGGTLTKNANYSLLYSPDQYTMHQYRTSAGAITDDDAAWTSTTARGHCCAIASFKGSGGGGGGGSRKILVGMF